MCRLSATKHIIRQIEQLGYVVKRFALNGTIELHAVRMPDGAAQVARCNDGDGPDEEDRAACLLAEAVGIDLEDG
jgi:hypothetical protein